MNTARKDSKKRKPKRLVRRAIGGAVMCLIMFGLAELFGGWALAIDASAALLSPSEGLSEEAILAALGFLGCRILSLLMFVQWVGWVVYHLALELPKRLSAAR
jgi:hypothetical protein